jgi:hypothetical protein
MARHLFAWVSGFGWTLAPFTPCRLEQLAGPPPAVRAFHHGPEGTREAVLRFGGEEPTVELAPGTSSLREVIEVVEGPAGDHWRIETNVFSIPWPAAFAFESSGERTPPVFYLRGPDDALVYVQGPFPPEKRPGLADLAAPGQTVHRQGETAGSHWVELDYIHDGRPWRQRQYLVSPWPSAHFVLVSTQAREEHAELTARAADEIASRIASPSE